jgi:hypothetical protein
MITLAEIQATGLDQTEHGAIAAALSAGRTKRVPTEIGNGKILETIGLAAGNALLDAIYNAPDFKYVVPLLEQGRLDISSDVSRAALDALALGGACSQANADKLKALAEQPDVVTVQQVIEAIQNGA